MLHKIIEFSVKNKLYIILMTIALIGYGSYQVTQLSLDAVPDITDNQVQVLTVAPALGATDIERLVTFPIEQANSNIAGTKQIRSFSRFGLSLITIVFEDDVDIYWARQQVGERLGQVKDQIPAGVGTPELGPISTGLGEIYQYVVRPEKGYEDQFDLTELRTIQDWLVRQQLLNVKGVAEVSSFGGNLKQLEVAVNADRLNSYGVEISDLFDAIANNNDNTGGAYIEKGPTTLYIRSEGLIGSIEDIKNTVIKSNVNGLPLLIKDVAEVKIGKAIRYGAMTYNGSQEVAGAVVMMLKGENSSKVVVKVKERIAEIQKTLPKGVVIEPFLDRTKMVNNSIATVEQNLLEGALIVLFVLVFFLGNIRAGFLVASMIPLSMLFAICMMNAFGVSGNLMSLGALDFGLIVDGAVIIVETILHHLTSKKLFGRTTVLSQAKMDEEVVSSSSKMMNSAVFGQIIILLVYLPIFSLQGIEGKMFIPMAQTVAFALLGAFILSLTYVPMMSSLVLDKNFKTKKNFSDRIMEKVERFYGKILRKVIRKTKLTISVIIGLFVFSMFVASTLGGEFIPSLEEGDFAVETRVLSGSSLSTTMEYSSKAAKILKDQFPEVEKVVTKIGSGEVPTDPMPMDAADMLVILKNKKEWTSASNITELSEKMSAAVAVVPGITTSFQYPVQMRFNELMTGARQDVVIKIFGDDLDKLAKSAAELGELIKTVDGAQNLYIEPITGMPQVVISYKRDQIAKYGFHINAINKAINMGFAGQSAGMFYEGERRFDLVVRLDGNNKQNVNDIQNLLIASPTGMQIPLKELADVSIVNGPNQIQREDAKRRIIVGFNVKDKDIQTVVEELKLKVDKSLKFEPGYYIKYGGSYENLNDAKARLSLVVPIALAMIFVLLYIAFKSIKESLIIYTAIPLSAIGGILLLASRGLPFSISAGVGFIALFGIAVLNGIVLLSEFNSIRKSGVTDPIKIIFKGTHARLRPVLMTAFVASFGFIPMALSNGAGAAVQRPLATVVIGGLMSATFLTLFLLPIIYYLMIKNENKKLGLSKVIPNAKSLIIGGLLLFSIGGNAQEIPFTQAQEHIKAENLNLKYQRGLVNRNKQAENETTVLGPTSFSAGFGQLNGPYYDTNFGVEQTLQFPTVYSKLKQVAKKNSAISEMLLKSSEDLLQRDLHNLYVQYTIASKKMVILSFADSIYGQAMIRQQNRLKLGDINKVELAVFENQRFQIMNQLKQIEVAKAQLIHDFRRLLNTDQKEVPALLNFDEVNTTGLTYNPSHSELKVKEAEIELIKANKESVKSKLLPELTLAYNNASFKGNAPNDLYYDTSHRFSSYQIGVAVPIFQNGIRNSMKTLDMDVKLKEEELEITKLQFENTVLNLQESIQKQREIVNYYQQKMLPSNQVLNHIHAIFYEGDISYIEFVTLVNQNMESQSNFLDVQSNLYQSIVLLNYYTL